MTIMPTDVAVLIALVALALGAIIGCATVAAIELLSGLQAGQGEEAE